MILTLIQTILLLEKPWDSRVILNDFTIHINDVKRSIRPYPQIHGPEPLISGRKELRLLLFRRSSSPVAGTIAREN